MTCGMHRCLHVYLTKATLLFYCVQRTATLMHHFKSHHMFSAQNLPKFRTVNKVRSVSQINLDPTLTGGSHSNYNHNRNDSCCLNPKMFWTYSIVLKFNTLRFWDRFGPRFQACFCQKKNRDCITTIYTVIKPRLSSD